MATRTTAKNPAITIEDAVLGGLADSIYLGPKNSLASIVGLDLHSVPGLVQVNQKFTVDTNAPTDDLYKIVPCSDGNIYLFGKSNGKIYQNNAGTYTLEATTAPAAGSNGILDAIEYDGYIYYSMQNRLGRWQLGTAWSTRNDSYKTFTNGNSSYHPMCIQNIVLYIGDGNLVAQFDNSSSAFVANALTLETAYTVSSLGINTTPGTDLLIGTIVANGVNKARVFRWNTWGVSFTDSAYVDEVGINAFIQSFDVVIVSAGLNGNLYIYQGNQLVPIKKIPGTYSNTQTGIVNYPATGNFRGLPIFAFSNSSGNPATQGIYGFGFSNAGYPRILTVEFTVSSGVISNLNIWSIATKNNDVYISWNDTNAGTYRIDKLDWSNKINGAYFETLVVKYTSIFLDEFEEFFLNYGNGSLPSGTSLDLYYKINGGSYVKFDPTTDATIDTDRSFVEFVRNLKAKTLQLKVVFNVSGNNAPSLESVVMPLR